MYEKSENIRKEIFRFLLKNGESNEEKIVEHVIRKLGYSRVAIKNHLKKMRFSELEYIRKSHKNRIYRLPKEKNNSIKFKMELTNKISSINRKLDKIDQLKTPTELVKIPLLISQLESLQYLVSIYKLITSNGTYEKNLKDIGKDIDRTYSRFPQMMNRIKHSEQNEFWNSMTNTLFLKSKISNQKYQTVTSVSLPKNRGKR